ncbi:energy transducer TonB [Tenacibaculum sp. 190524A02b]|uniref:energy transducer TonB n=1 Tax=Tenacibaculum vairaonense TaxID=3137860 RepID=UPI0031FB098D
MKKLHFFLAFYAISFIINAQNYQTGDTIYYEKGIITQYKNKATSYSIIKKIKNVNEITFYKVNNFIPSDTLKLSYRLYASFRTKILETLNSSDGEFKTFHKNGKLQKEGIKAKGKKIGTWKFWYQNGKIREERFYPKNITLAKNFKHYKVLNFWDREGIQTITDGTGFFEFKKGKTIYKGSYQKKLRHGKFTEIKNGKTQFEEYYIRGKLKSGTSWDENGKTYKYKQVFKQPRYRKGQESIKKHIIKNFNMPRYAVKNNIAGKIMVNFRVTKKGLLDDIKVAKKLCQPCDAEAIRAVKSMGKWKPAKYRGKNINIRYSIPLTL